MRHEVGNHLTAVRLGAGSLVKATAAEQVRALALELEQVSGEAAMLLSQLRFLSDEVTLCPEPVQPCNLLEDLRRGLVRFKVDTERLDVDCPADLPACYVDRDVVLRQLTAMVAAAADSAPQRLQVRAERSGPRLDVVCSGASFDAPALLTLEPQRGSVLALQIVAVVLEEAGCELWLQADGPLTTLRLRLPLADA